MLVYRHYTGRNKIRRWGKRGTALPAVLIVIVLISLLGSALLSLVLLERRSGSNAQKICQAGYLAEAGLNLALAHLRQEPGWQQGIGVTSLPGIEGKIEEVSVSSRVMSYRLRSTATVGGISQTLVLELARPFSSYALACAGSLTLQDTLSVEGDIFSLGSVRLPDGAAANVIAGGDLTNMGIVGGSVICGGYLFNSGMIRGDATVGCSSDRYGRDPNHYGKINGQLNKGLLVPLPDWPADLVEPYQQAAWLAPGEYTLAEIQAIVNGLPGEVKTLYCGGDLAIMPVTATLPEGEGLPEEQNYYRTRAIIAAAGDIYLAQDMRAESTADAWAFIAGQDLILAGGVTVDAVLACAGYFYKQGEMSTINGALLAGSIELITADSDSNTSMSGKGRGWIKGRLSISFNPAIVEALTSWLPTSTWQVLAWQQASLY
ncbi:MAG: hypothetical protein GX039_08185 [Clostridia bacterium]|nr:hypothetical protein [Clostridia bacterium]